MGLRGEITVPGDKSISHRGVMFGSISNGITELTGFLNGADCRSTISCFRQMGIDIVQENDHVIVHGKGLHGLSAPADTLDTGNSGTTTRIISGILSGQYFSSRLCGDESIQKRPMNRVIDPLSRMGADIKSEPDNGCCPLVINPAELTGITFESNVASAQVKSAVLLAGLYAEGNTTVIEPTLSRNHTELMLTGFGAKLVSSKMPRANGVLCPSVTIFSNPVLTGQKITVPGDISSAAYFIAAGLITPNSEILIKNVNTNPTRAGILKVAEAMGGDISYIDERTVSGEPVADILVRTSSLHGTVIEGDIIPTLIDELPVIAIMAAAASGTTTIKDAAELKVKESDRIKTVSEGLTALGADVTPTNDGMIINGGKVLHGGDILTEKDHRIAMSFTIASLITSGEVNLDYPDCVNISYPTFYDSLEQLKR